MSELIRRKKHELIILSKGKKNQRIALLRSADKQLVDAISEIIFNLIIGNIKITSKQKKKLATYKNNLRKIASQSNSWRKRKHALVQTGGGFLPFLIPLVASLVGGLFK